ncbi:hypothetical protein PWJ57_06670 [Fructilactobacillus sanfranciscensis]|uniref:hypothetical protein n=1 Tax=Fructilactobacillus sanfranciscensis TaxID=1625 RepID=UPI0031F86E3C
MLKSEIETKDLLGIDLEMKKLIEDSSWGIIDAAPKFSYQNNVKTDTQVGSSWLLIGPRTGDKRIRNKELRITDNEVISKDVLDNIIESGTEVTISNLKLSSIWSNTEKNSVYANINIALSGKVNYKTDDETNEK